MGLIGGLLNLYIYVLLIGWVLSFIPSLQKNEFYSVLRNLTEPLLSKIRKFLPSDLPFDLSPLVAIVIIFAIRLLW